MQGEKNWANVSHDAMFQSRSQGKLQKNRFENLAVAFAGRNWNASEQPLSCNVGIDFPQCGALSRDKLTKTKEGVNCGGWEIDQERGQKGKKVKAKYWPAMLKKRVKCHKEMEVERCKDALNRTEKGENCGD